jgi:hypothetical protein
MNAYRRTVTPRVPAKGLTGKIIPTPHFRAQVLAKGFTMSQIVSALTHPDKVTDVTDYPGQKRYCGAGVAVVMDGNTTVTAYVDGVVTDLREDQRRDPRALNSRRLATVTR